MEALRSRPTHWGLMPGRRRHIALLSLTLLVVLGAHLDGLCGRGGRDRENPTQPGPLVVSSSDANSIELTWEASSDNVGVEGYDVFVGTDRYVTNQQSVLGSLNVLKALVSGLRCGQGYQVGVEAFDDAGNRSKRTSAV